MFHMVAGTYIYVRNRDQCRYVLFLSFSILVLSILSAANEYTEQRDFVMLSREQWCIKEHISTG